MAKKVFIAVGHGGSDPGAMGNGFKEKDLTLDIALACSDVLFRHGVEFLMSRTKDENDPVADEVKESNAYKPDLSVAIHINAAGGDGVEAFYHYGGGLSKTAATNIVNEIIKIGQNSRGTKIKKQADGRDYYRFIRETTDPATIVECAFIDNATDIKIIDTAAERVAMGTAIAKGILATLGIAYKEPPKAPAATNKLYRVQVGAYSVKANAERMKKELESKGYSAIIVEVNK